MNFNIKKKFILCKEKKNEIKNLILCTEKKKFFLLSEQK